MATPEELAKYIEFQLDRLGERNAHHEFEHICRRIAAARIASNILPATGPVTSGGDQGSDFETHPTELANEIRGALPRTWVALASQDRIKFCATIQRTDLRLKIEADVDTIMGHGDPPCRIHAFTAGAISKGQRAKAIKNVREQHSVELVVHDVVYLAEQLAQPDLYWIARRYLDIPEELAPNDDDRREDGAPEWYVEDRERWRSRDPFVTMGDLLDLTDGLRHATWNAHAKPDLGFWLGLVRPLADARHPREIRLRARYEVAVAVLRGQGSLFPAEDLVRAYFEEIGDDDPPEALGRASALLLYARNAVMYRQSAIQLSELDGWEQELVRIVDQRVASETGPNRLAELLWTQGFIWLQPAFDEHDVPQEPQEIPDTSRWQDRDQLMADAQRREISAEQMKDVDRGMASWVRLARMLDHAPLFAVDDLALMLSVLATALVDHPEWRDLNDSVELALARQAGQVVVAARCRDRAVMLRRRGRHREALHELHRAKLDWWTGGTLRGALLVLLIAADSYHALGLDHAAAQCALSVAYVAQDRTNPDHRDLMAPALALAARLEYGWGAWIGATELTELAILTAAHYREGGIDPGSDMMQPLLTHAGMIEAAGAVYLGAAAGGVLAEALERVSVGDMLGGDPRAAWKETGKLTTPDEWDDAARSGLAGPPFQDAANAFVLRFSVLGQDWSVRAAEPGDARCRRVCERFAAAAQVLLLELSEHDLCLLATPVDVTLAIRSGRGGLRTRTKSTNNRRAWRFELSPVDDDIDDQMNELLEVLTKVILDTSLLPGEAFIASMESAFQRGLHHKLLPGRPYDELRAAFEDNELRRKVGDARRPDVPKDWNGPAASVLGRPTGPGPTFRDELAGELAMGRYEKITRRIPRQLEVLRKDPAFMEVRTALRDRGWPDHLVLLGVYNITMNYRVAVSGLNLRDAGDRERLQGLQEHPETKGSPLAPVRRFTAEEMDQARRLAMIPTLQLWDLTTHSPMPDLDAIEALLAERYAYWTADAEHDDPFAS